MKQILFILTFLITISIYGQKCDTINGKYVNCIDSDNLKQGFWKITEKKILLSWHSGYGSKDGCQYGENVEYIPLSEGQYKNDKKVGTWKYFKTNNLTILTEKEITYLNNEEIKVLNFNENTTIEYNKDSTIIKGFLNYKKDTIYLNCSEKKCSFKLESDKEIIAFDLTEFFKFDYELTRLKIGMYDRKIKEID
jgi:hypothetical protein